MVIPPMPSEPGNTTNVSALASAGSLLSRRHLTVWTLTCWLMNTQLDIARLHSALLQQQKCLFASDSWCQALPCPWGHDWKITKLLAEPKKMFGLECTCLTLCANEYHNSQCHLHLKLALMATCFQKDLSSEHQWKSWSLKWVKGQIKSMLCIWN